MQIHTPVLVKEVLYFLDVRPGRRFIDATVGGGGHTEAILKEEGEVLGIDQDPKSLEFAKRRLEQACPQGVFKLTPGNFSRLSEIAKAEGFRSIDGILFDLGFASFQIDDPSRGLSFTKEGPLDMRLSPDLGVTAADLLNALPERKLYQLFSEFGQENRARAVARAVVRRRTLKPFQTTGQLRELVEEVYGGPAGKIHPATKVFMALRIAVNQELENLEKALPQTLGLLRKGARLVVISFHSGEDRGVKDFLKSQERAESLKILTKKPIVPSEQEVRENPRSRSAKLRAAEKI